MATGNGAYVVHKMIEKHVDGYRVYGYNPWWEYFPVTFPLFFRGQKPSLVHTTPDYGYLFRRTGSPLVVTVHNFVLDSFMKRYSSWAQRIHYKTDLLFFTRLSIEKADCITAVSKFTADMVREELGFRGPIRIIYNGIDTRRFHPPQKIENRKNVRVLFAGNLSRRKGADLLPKIASRLASGIEIFFTRGLRNRVLFPDSSNLRSLQKIPYQRMPEVYRNADILLLPTVREGFVLVVAEAMACGLPVVASDCSAIPELVDHGKGGFLCPVGDVDAFAERINQLADSPAIRKEMGEYNRAKIEKHFTLDRMISEYRNLFEEVLDRRSLN